MALLLKILSVIGVILLILLCLVLALLLMVLFVPIRYRAAVTKHGGTVDVSGNFSWLLHLIHAPFTVHVEGLEKKQSQEAPQSGGEIQPQDASQSGRDTQGAEPDGESAARKIKKDMTWDLKVLGFSLKKFLNKDSSAGEDSGISPDKDSGSGVKTEIIPDKDSGSKEKSGISPDKDNGSGKKFGISPDEDSGTGKKSESERKAEKPASAGEIRKEASKPASVYTPEEAARRAREGAKRKPAVQPGEKRPEAQTAKSEIPIEIVPARRPSQFEMLLARYGGLIGKLKKGMEKGQSAAEVLMAWLDYVDSDSFEHAVSSIINEAKAIIRHLFPTRITGTIEYGTGDPAMTGEILAGIAVFYPALPRKLTILPDFEEQKLEADTDSHGRIVIGVLVFRVLKLLLTRDVRDFIARIRAKNPEDPALRRAAEKEKKRARKIAAKAAAKRRKAREKARKKNGGSGKNKNTGNGSNSKHNSNGKNCKNSSNGKNCKNSSNGKNCTNSSNGSTIKDNNRQKEAGRNGR